MDFSQHWTPPDAVPRACIVQAAANYAVPVRGLLAIMRVESNGNHKAIRKNSNGTFDYGLMQHNTGSWVKIFAKFGIQKENLLDPCVSVHAGAYVLRWEINKAGGDFWRGVARYHAPNNPRLGQIYVQKVARASLTVGL